MSDIRLTFTRVVRAEWTKLTSLRSTWYVLAGISIAAVGIAGAIGHAVRNQIDGGDPLPTRAQALGAAFLPVDFYMLIVGVLGVLAMTGEYPGPVRATLTAVPRRRAVVAAKAVVLAAVTTPVLAVVALTSFVVSQAFLGDAGLSLGDAGVAGAVVGAAACPVLVGLFGLGIGTLLRHSAAAITVLVTTLFVLPALLLGVLPDDVETDVLRYAPTSAGQAMYGSLDGGDSPVDTLSPVASAGVLGGWVALSLAGGVAVLSRRDA